MVSYLTLLIDKPALDAVVVIDQTRCVSPKGVVTRWLLVARAVECPAL